MNLALEEAKKACQNDEVPVGAVVVFQGSVIGVGHNKRETQNNSLAHAEIIAINKACEHLRSWRLVGCDLYVTLEPCLMCAGAIVNSRISRVIFGAKDPKAGGCGSVVNILDLPLNHKPEIISGVLENQSAQLLQNFFKKLRKSKIQKNLEKNQKI